MGGSSSNSSNTTQQTSEDRRVTTGEGDITALQDNTITLESGSSVTLINRDPGAVSVAFEALAEQSARSTEAAVELAKVSSAAASKLAESQEQFVATASGQKYVLYILMGLAALVGLPVLFSFLKKQTS